MKTPTPKALLTLLILTEVGKADPLDTWTWLNPPPTQKALYSVVYGDGQFVAVGDAGIVLTSADGVKWAQHLAQQPEGLTRLIDIVYGNGHFVAVEVFGFNEGSGIQTSVDGVSWVQRQVAGDDARARARVFGIAYGDGLFVAVGEDRLQTSADGTNWVQRPSGVTNVLYGIAYGNGQFVAVGGTIQTSADGITWVQRSSRTQEDLQGIAYGNGQFVAVGRRYHGTSGHWVNESTIVTSADGETWVQRESGTTDAILRSVAYGDGQFVAVGGDTIQTSADGVKWVQRERAPIWLSGITYGNGHFVAVGDGGILESGSIITLAITPNPHPGLLTLSVSGPTGLGYTIQKSTDLISWQVFTNINSVPTGTVTLETMPATADHEFYRAYSQ